MQYQNIQTKSVLMTYGSHWEAWGPRWVTGLITCIAYLADPGKARGCSTNTAVELDLQRGGLFTTGLPCLVYRMASHTLYLLLIPQSGVGLDQQIWVMTSNTGSCTLNIALLHYSITALLQVLETYSIEERTNSIRLLLLLLCMLK